MASDPQSPPSDPHEDGLETTPSSDASKDVLLVDHGSDEAYELTELNLSPPPPRADPRQAALPTEPPRPTFNDPADLFDTSDDETLLNALDTFDEPTELAPLPSPAAVSSTPVPAPSEDAPWHQLHPASLYINLLPQTYRTLRGLWPLLLLMVFGGQGNGTAGVDFTLLLVFFSISISRTVVHFLTLRYRLQAGKLEIRSGLLNRRSRVLDPYRIQNIELAQNPLHKLAGLVELRIETAGDTSTDGLLSALKEPEAQQLKDALEQLAHARNPQGVAPETAEEEPLLHIDVVELVAFGLSRRRAGTVALLFAAGMEVMTYLDPYQTQQITQELRSGHLIGAVLLAFAGTWLFSAGQAILRHFNFRLTLRGDRLVTSEGLLTRRSVEIPQSKVQIVRIDEPWMRRQMGYGTMLIETAALGMADGDVRQAEGVIPMVPAEQLANLTQQAAPVLTVDPWQTKLQPAHPRALYRLAVANLLRATMLCGLLLWLLPWPWGLGSLVLLPLSIPLSWLDWHNQGWLVTPRVILARRGYLTRRTWVIDRSKVQSVHMGQTPLMRWHGLMGVHISVAGSQVRLPDVGHGVGMDILQRLRETWTPHSPL